VKVLYQCPAPQYQRLTICLDKWVPIKPYHSILRLVSRISARIFLGLPYCRNEEWLEISTEFTENGLYHISKDLNKHC